MKQDLDISNIESKPTDSNPFQKGDAVRLKQSDGCYPKGTMFIVDGLIGNSMVIVFRGVHGVMASVDKYEKTTASAKTLRKIRKRLVSVDETCSMNIKPKRPYPKRVVKSKYDAVLFDLKMAQTALDNRNKEIDGWVKQNNELRAEIEKDRQLYREVLNERDKLKESVEHYADFSKQRLELIAELEAERDRKEREIQQVAKIGLKWKMEADQLTAELRRKCDALEAERDKLQAENDKMVKSITNLQGSNLRYKEERNVLIAKPTEYANLDTLARTLRDQRDTARFLAALFFLASAGFAVAVLVGRLVPVY